MRRSDLILVFIFFLVCFLLLIYVELLLGASIDNGFWLEISWSNFRSSRSFIFYSAIKIDAKSQNVKPHIMVIPLWPGDSAFSSIYQHYVSIYNIRMINGYCPASIISLRILEVIQVTRSEWSRRQKRMLIDFLGQEQL